MDLDLIDFLMVNYHMDMKDSNQEEPRWQYFSYTISSRYQSLQDSDKMSKYLFYQLQVNQDFQKELRESEDEDEKEHLYTVYILREIQKLCQPYNQYTNNDYTKFKINFSKWGNNELKTNIFLRLRQESEAKCLDIIKFKQVMKEFDYEADFKILIVYLLRQSKSLDYIETHALDSIQQSVLVKGTGKMRETQNFGLKPPSFKL